MIIYIGMDDTDNSESRGTGRLARAVAGQLSDGFNVLGVVRHQFLVDPRIPYTSHNSSAVILLDGPESTPLEEVFGQVQGMMLDDFQPGSDPGLCVTSNVPEAIQTFGHKAQGKVVSQQEARDLAATHDILLRGLGGSEDGVIGALAGVGLSAGGSDGRYVMVGRIRDLTGLQTVETILQAGITSVQTRDGRCVEEGLILADKLRPARRDGVPVAVVDWTGDYWQPVKLN